MSTAGRRSTVTSSRWRDMAIAGHLGHEDLAREGLADADHVVRELALGALDRCGALDDADVVAAFGDHAPSVRRRAASLAAKRPNVDLVVLLDDIDPTVAEQAAWSYGEHVEVSDEVLGRLIELATDDVTPLVREAAIAALGAIGDERGLPAILRGCVDQPAIRRRAVLALAPFDTDAAEAAIDAAMADRDWQVRQAAEDLRRG